MSYRATGDTLDNLTTAAGAALQVAADPYLPEVACSVMRLSAMEQGKNPGPPCAKTSKNASTGQGIGLRYVVVPVRLAVKAREQPWVLPVVAGTLVLGIFMIGFAAGRTR